MDRPSSCPYPMVWKRWEISKGGTIFKFRVQDAVEENLNQIKCHLIEHFMEDEPFVSSQAMKNDEESLKDCVAYWHKEIKGGVFLVCFEESDDPTISDKFVGCNVTGVRYKDHPFNFVCKGQASSLVNIIMNHMLDASQTFAQFNVDRYLAAHGLSVHKDYRGMGIGVQILKARTEMCKAMGIPLTVAAFTSVQGQAAARQAGFELLQEITYAEIEKEFPEINLTHIKAYSVQLMYKRV